MYYLLLDRRRYPWEELEGSEDELRLVHLNMFPGETYTNYQFLGSMLVFGGVKDSNDFLLSVKF